MFGYIVPNKPELKIREFTRYRGFYCGLCRELKSQYGPMGELTLTYDMTFLVMLLNSLYEPEESESEIRCAVHPVRKHLQIQSEATRYGADMNLLLAYYNLQDDARDDHSLMAGTGARLLRSQALKIAERYPRQAQVIRKELSILNRLEAENVQDPGRAARCFGRLLGQIFVWKDDMWQKQLYRIGYYMGLYIYLTDAFYDQAEDIEKGSYNPLLKKRPDADSFHKLRMRVMARAAENFELLPILKDAELLRNIIYSGVFQVNRKGNRFAFKRSL